MTPLYILKLGGGLITEKDLPWPPTVRKADLKRIAKEIAKALKQSTIKLIIVHGAGNYGHPIVKQSKIHEGIQESDNIQEKLLRLGETQTLQNMLNTEVCNALIQEKVPAFPYQPSSIATMKERHMIEEFDTSIIEGLLDLGIVPVLYGVPALDASQKISILSGDDLVPYLSQKLKADSSIYATREEGVQDEEGKTIPRITHKNYRQASKSLQESSAPDVTGGMEAKIAKILQTKNMQAMIINGNQPDTILKALQGKKTEGTIVDTRG